MSAVLGQSKVTVTVTKTAWELLLQTQNPSHGGVSLAGINHETWNAS